MIYLITIETMATETSLMWFTDVVATATAFPSNPFGFNVIVIILDWYSTLLLRMISPIGC